MAVSSRAYPSLERKPGGPDNWVEVAGGLPDYIERIAKHLHYERGFTISHAIATAVNTVKRWARKGGVVKYNDPNRKTVTVVTAAKAAKAVAEWEAKKRIGSAALTSYGTIDPSDQIDLGVDVQALVNRANAVVDPVARAEARATLLDLATTKDGRRSYKRQGKWKHGFIPVDDEAKESKAKGSDEARRRIERLYGNPTTAAKASEEAKDRFVERRKKGLLNKNDSAPGGKSMIRLEAQSDTNKQDGGTGRTERVARVGQARNPDIDTQTREQRASSTGSDRQRRLEESKGGGRSARARQRWEDIDGSQKTVRNGKRYVMTVYNGRRQLTEHIGPNDNYVPGSAQTPTRYRTLMQSDAKKMSTAQIRKMLDDSRTTKEVRKVLNKVLREKTRRKETSRG